MDPNGLNFYSYPQNSFFYIEDSLTPGYSWYASYGVSTSQYFRIDACGTYHFNMAVMHGDVNNCDNDADMSLSILTLDGTDIKDMSCGDFNLNCPLDGQGNCTTRLYQNTSADSVYLNKGLYMLTSDIHFFHNACADIYGSSANTGFESYFRLYSDIHNAYKSLASVSNCTFTTPIAANDDFLNPTPDQALLNTGKKMVFSTWVREDCGNPANNTPCTATTYTNNQVILHLTNGDTVLTPAGPIVEGWQRYEGYFVPSSTDTTLAISFVNNGSRNVYFDDVRVHPYNAVMKSYIYDPVNLRLAAELDPNNYARFYEYDEEGLLIRSKAETKQGVKTIQETRSAKQKIIKSFQ
jgi:hypothetical protein